MRSMWVSASKVKAGQPLFKLDTSEEEAAAETARRRIVETDAELALAKTQLAVADAQVQQAQSAYQQAADELATKEELQRRSPSTVAQREVDKLRVAVDGRQAGVAAALASKQSVEAQISAVLPAQKASSEAALAEAQVEIDRAVVRAGVDGTLEQFTLRKGDVVNPMLRPAGTLVPSEAGRQSLIASFGQIEAQVMKVGMLAEVSCASKPFTVIPMVVTEVQDVIATGQLRPTDQLVDVRTTQAAGPGSLTVFLEPLYEGGIDGIPPGSNCIGNAYTSNEEILATEDVSTAALVLSSRDRRCRPCACDDPSAANGAFARTDSCSPGALTRTPGLGGGAVRIRIVGVAWRRGSPPNVCSRPSADYPQSR